MRNIIKRLETIRASIEARSKDDNPGYWVAIYNPDTGELIEPIPESAELVFWIPDNGRGDDNGE